MKQTRREFLKAAGVGMLSVATVGLGAIEALGAFTASDLPRRFARAEILGREVPMLLEEDGVTWWGWIDLIIREGREVVVIALRFVPCFSLSRASLA